MSAFLVAGLCLTMVGTSFLSGIFGMAGGLILVGVLLALLPLPEAMLLHGVTQLASNGWRGLLWWRHVRWNAVAFYLSGCALALLLWSFTRYVPPTPLALLLLGVTPFMVRLVPDSLRPNPESPLQGTLYGSLCMSLILLTGVAGPLIDTYFLGGKLDRREIVATKAVCQIFGHAAKLIYFGALIDQAATLDPVVAVLAIACSMLGTTLAARVLAAMSDKQFRAWANRIITAIASYYVAHAAYLLLIVPMLALVSPSSLHGSRRGVALDRGGAEFDESPRIQRPHGAGKTIRLGGTAVAGKQWDVVVVGAGNAAFCAALAARENGASVLMVERAPKELMGGNSRFTAGAFRCVYDGVDDLKAIMPDLTAAEIDRSDFGTYTQDQFYDDMFRITNYRTDGDLCDRLVGRSRDAMRWLHSKGMKFDPIWGRQAYLIDGKFKFWGGLTVESKGGGPGLVEQHLKLAEKQGIDIVYGTRAVELIYDGNVVRGVKVKVNGAIEEIKCKSVVIACGGFESSAEMRTKYLGPGWELAKVRGTPYNTGDGINMALAIGASSFGNWSGSHAVQWDYNAPEFGDLSVGDNFQKHSYPWGILINATGRRFVDEGADFRNYTYAKYGAVVLKQPNNFAYQVFDGKIVPMLRAEYRIKRVSKVSANTIEEFAHKLEGVNAEAFLDEIKKYNAAVKKDVPFNPNVKDGRGTVGLDFNKSNWANTIEEPPFEAYQVGCGVSFSFGGVRIDPDTGQVIDSDMNPIPGLYAAGELVGGIFYFNYPGGSGLMSGAVFGKIAGTGAASTVRNA